MNSGFVVQRLPAPGARYCGVASGAAWPLADATDEAARELTAAVESSFGILPDGKFALWLVGDRLAARYAAECERRALSCRVLFLHSAEPGGVLPAPSADRDLLGCDYVSPDLVYSFLEDAHR